MRTTCAGGLKRGDLFAANRPRNLGGSDVDLAKAYLMVEPLADHSENER